MATFSKSTLDHVALGQKGGVFIDGTADGYTGNFIKIQVITNCKFSSLLPVNDEFIGTVGGNGDVIPTGLEFPAGITILGHWTEIKITAGSVIAYQSTSSKVIE